MIKSAAEEVSKLVEEKDLKLNYSMLILDLRKKMEETAKELEKLEKDGSEDAASKAIWLAHYVWDGKEYSALEKALRSKGYKSSIELLMEERKKD